MSVKRVLYRQLLRAARKIDECTVNQQRDIQRFRGFLPAAFPESEKPKLEKGDMTLSKMLRVAFESPLSTEESTLEEKQEQARIGRAFAALRAASRRVSVITAADWRPKEQSKPSAVRLDIGQIFRHKRHGFRGVVADWFEKCPAPDEWVEAYGPFERGTDQPFYHTLVDTRDRPVPLFALAAEENLIPLFGEKELPIQHPMMERFFTESFDKSGRHQMREELKDKFPDDY